MAEDRRQEFEALALPLARSLYSAARRLTGRDEDAKDVVQEVFLRGYRTFGSFARGTNAKAWLFTIMRSVLSNRRRRSYRRPEAISLEALDERYAGRAGPEPPAHVSDDEVEQALGRLPEEFRLAVVLVDIEGFTYEEAAGVLGCPVGTVRSRLSRARRALYVELQGYARRAGYSVRGDEP